MPSHAASTSHKVALISGTSSGIGLATAVALAEAGWTTVATMRNLERSGALRAAAESAGVDVEIRELDVTDAASIQRAVDETIAAHGQIDALMNNAGAASVGTIELTGMDQLRSAMEVNFFGVAELTKAALPALRESHGRLITITSVGGVIGQPFNEAYCAAKFAVEGFMQSLHPVAATVGVRVSVIEPGPVASEFIANARIDPATALSSAGPYASALGHYLERTMKQFASSNAQQPGDIAQVVLECLDAAEPDFRWQTSEWSRAFVGTSLADVDGSGVTGMTAGWVK